MIIKKILGLKRKLEEIFYILTSAEDVNGNAKLNFLKILLISIFITSLAFIWVFSFIL